MLIMWQNVGKRDNPSAIKQSSVLECYFFTGQCEEHTHATERGMLSPQCSRPRGPVDSQLPRCNRCIEQHVLCTDVWLARTQSVLEIYAGRRAGKDRKRCFTNASGIYSFATTDLESCSPAPTEGSGHVSFLSGGKLTLSGQQLAPSSSCFHPAAFPVPSQPVERVCVLPLRFKDTRSRCGLSGAHCHSISTTRLSSKQPGRRHGARQPICYVGPRISANHRRRSPKATAKAANENHRSLLTNRMRTACRWTQTGDGEFASGSEGCGTRGMNCAHD